MKGRGMVESSLGVVSGLLFLALLAELYYIFWWKKKQLLPCNSDSNSSSYASKFLPCFNFYFKSTTPAPDAVAHPPNSPPAPAPAPAPAVDQDSLLKASVSAPHGEEAIDAELMRLHSLSGPPRFLFTIKEETREDMESDGAKSRKGSRGTSLGDLLHCAESPLLTPLSSPPLLGLGIAKRFVHFDSLKKLGLNPLFESSHSSPPPKLRFLQEAEEKLQVQSCRGG
jgi:hypothetical protein